MKHVVTVVAVLTTLSPTASPASVRAQTMAKPAVSQPAMSSHAADEKAVMANENRILDLFPKKDIATLKTLIADDALGVDMTGAMPVSEIFKQFPTMDMKITTQKTSDFKFLWVDANTVVVSYTWTGSGTTMGQPVPSPTYSSTVWTKRAGKWMAVFHQETVAAPPAKK